MERKFIKVFEGGFLVVYSVRNDTENKDRPRYIWTSSYAADSGNYRETFQEAWNDMEREIEQRLKNMVESSRKNLSDAEGELKNFRLNIKTS